MDALHIPVRLLGLAVEISSVGQLLIEQPDHRNPGRVGKIDRRLKGSLELGVEIAIFYEPNFAFVFGHAASTPFVSGCRVRERMRPRRHSTGHLLHRVPCVLTSSRPGSGPTSRRLTDCNHAAVLLDHRQRPCRLLAPWSRARRGHRPRPGYPSRLRHRRAADADRVGACPGERSSVTEFRVCTSRSTTSTRRRRPRCWTPWPSSTTPARPAPPVAVHCLAGQGRTGTVLAAYLIRGGLSSEQAIAEVRAICPGAIEATPQTTALAGWAAERPWII